MKKQILDWTRPVRHKISRTLSPRLMEKHHWRPFIHFLRDLKLKDLVGVEVGVSSGLNALSILHKLDMKHLFLVDNYLEENKLDPNEDYPENKRLAIQRLGTKSNVFFVFADSTSDVAADAIPVNCDFVYIDGDHTYDGVMKDLLFYWDRIRKGGYMGGHDFYGDFPDVVFAVIDFCEARDLDLKTKNFDWWVQK
jgi:hypothetical protein